VLGRTDVHVAVWSLKIAWVAVSGGPSLRMEIADIEKLPVPNGAHRISHDARTHGAVALAFEEDGVARARVFLLLFATL
jgi:hypothetical protein